MAIINKIAGSIRQIFVNTACFFLYYVRLIAVPEFGAGSPKMSITSLEIMVSENKTWL